MKLFVDLDGYPNPGECFGSQRLDIVIINGKEVIVIELSVCYETRTEEARNFKKRRYQNLKSDLSIEWEKLNIIYVEITTLGFVSRNIKDFASFVKLKCYMDWFLSLICKNYIFKHFVKTVEPTSLKFCMIIEPIDLHLEYTIAQVKYANFSYAHAQTFILLNGEMATVSTGFRKLKFWLWLLQTVFYLNQTGF